MSRLQGGRRRRVGSAGQVALLAGEEKARGAALARKLMAERALVRRDYETARYHAQRGLELLIAPDLCPEGKALKVILARIAAGAGAAVAS